MDDLHNKARQLRRNLTPQEQILWNILRKKQCSEHRFLRQYVIPPYIVDFICKKKKLIIEVDGGQHAENISYDEERTKYLESLGYKVIRFWNNDIDNNIEGVFEEIDKYIN